MFADARRIPLLIALLLAADCALALIPVIDFAVGHPGHDEIAEIHERPRAARAGCC